MVEEKKKPRHITCYEICTHPVSKISTQLAILEILQRKERKVERLRKISINY